MKIVYSLPHPHDRLDSEQAGHIVRARALLAALEQLGHEIVRVQAASGGGSGAAVSTYRQVVKKLLPRPLAMRMRDMGRAAFGRRYAQHLIDVVRNEQPDVILETHIAFSVAGKEASRATDIPLVLDDVAPSWEEERQYGVGAKKLALTIYREVTGQASLLVAVSEVIRRLLVEDGLPEEKIITVSNGIDEAAFRPSAKGAAVRERLGIGPETVVIVFVGSFQPYHRVDLLLDAFARIPGRERARVLLVGEGRETPAAQAHARALNIADRVTFAGRIPYREVADWVAAGDIAVMPATNTYGNPMKVYEYMAVGKAIVAPDQPTITEVVQHGDTAQLFEPGSIDALAKALTALTDDPELRARLGAAAAQAALQHTWTQRAKTLATAMEHIVNRSVGR